jgi:putative tryptophan/tyrosine transport system substrate-binding protein
LDFGLPILDLGEIQMHERIWMRSSNSRFGNRKSKIQNLKFAVLVGAMVFALCVSADAQQGSKPHRIGYLSSYGGPEPRFEAFERGLRELGYVEGKNLLVDRRFANANAKLLRSFAEELVGLKVDVIFTSTTPAIQVVKKATSTIPIVMISAADPVDAGLVSSLARPEGNVTGLTSISADLYGKRLDLLKEIIPQLSRVAVLRDPNFSSRSPKAYTEVESDAEKLGLKLQSLDIRQPGDFEGAFRVAVKARSQAGIHFNHTVIVANRKLMTELALKSRLPMMLNDAQFMDAGGLMSYGTYGPDLFRRAATYVDKILKGATPRDLPIERPVKFEFIVNLKTAKQIGLTIPPNVLARADRVIR